MSEYSMPSYFQTMPVIGKEVAHFSEENAAQIQEVEQEIHEIREAALEAGKHVLCEKPLASNAREARQMVAVARECGVTGARMMGGGFGGCTINLVKDDLFADFIATAKRKFTERFGHEPKVYPVVISDGAHKID